MRSWAALEWVVLLGFVAGTIACGAGNARKSSRSRVASPPEVSPPRINDGSIFGTGSWAAERFDLVVDADGALLERTPPTEENVSVASAWRDNGFEAHFRFSVYLREDDEDIWGFLERMRRVRRDSGWFVSDIAPGSVSGLGASGLTFKAESNGRAAQFLLGRRGRCEFFLSVQAIPASQLGLVFEKLTKAIHASSDGYWRPAGCRE